MRNRDDDCAPPGNFETQYLQEPPKFRLNVQVDDKYRVIQHMDGKLEATRYGEKWRDCVGDNLILSLAQQLETERELSGVTTELYKRLIKHSYETASISKAKASELLGCPLIDFDSIIKDIKGL